MPVLARYGFLKDPQKALPTLCGWTQMEPGIKIIRCNVLAAMLSTCEASFDNVEVTKATVGEEGMALIMRTI